MSTWEFIEDERSDHAMQYSVAKDGNTASWSDIVDALQAESTFRDALSGLITSSTFEQVFWETTPLNFERSGEPFQFAVVRARLNARQDSRAFSEFFDGERTVATFPNLGGSAMLVAPAPMEDSADRSYLKPFLTTAPSEQVHELWRSVGAAITDRLSDDPVWVSTSGGGVPWLHVRLDNSPKYYAYTPFRAWPPTAL